MLIGKITCEGRTIRSTQKTGHLKHSMQYYERKDSEKLQTMDPDF